MRYTTQEVVDAVRSALKASRGAWSDMDPKDLESQEVGTADRGLGFVDIFAQQVSRRFGTLVVEHLVAARAKFEAEETAGRELQSASLNLIWEDRNEQGSDD